MTLTPHIALLAILTTGVGFVMSRLGVRSGLLQARARRRCPSCGRTLAARGCTHCAPM